MKVRAALVQDTRRDLSAAGDPALSGGFERAKVRRIDAPPPETVVVARSAMPSGRP